MNVYEACVEEGVAAGPVLSPGWRWVPGTELSEYNLAGPHNRILHEMLKFGSVNQNQDISSANVLDS